VAWVAERKDVLSTLFFLLSIWTYAKYAECRASALKSQRVSMLQPAGYYALSLLLFALGLIEQTHGRDAALCSVAPRFLAAPALAALFCEETPDTDGPGRVGLWKMVLEKAPFFAFPRPQAAAINVPRSRDPGNEKCELDGLNGLHLAARTTRLISYCRYYFGTSCFPRSSSHSIIRSAVIGRGRGV